MADPPIPPGFLAIPAPNETPERRQWTETIRARYPDMAAIAVASLERASDADLERLARMVS